jgi:hypothetical protein
MFRRLWRRLTHQSINDSAHIEQHHEGDQKREKGHDHQYDMQVIGALNRIADKIIATAKQEQTDDNKRASRETLTIILLFLTVIFTGGADIIFYFTMKDARTIASNTHADFQDQEVRQLRAYVFPEYAAISGSDTDISKTDSVAPTIKFRIKNYGLTPAYGLTTLYSAILMPRNYEFPLHPARPLGNISIIHLAPSANTGETTIAVNNALAPLSVEQKNRLNNGDDAIFFVGEITYWDAFHKYLRCTRYKFYSYGGKDGVSMISAEDPEGIDTNCEMPSAIPLPPVPDEKL